MKIFIIFGLFLSGICFGQTDDYKIIDSTYAVNYQDIQKEKLNDLPLLNLVEVRDTFLLQSGRLILDKKPITDFFNLLPEEFKEIYSGLEITTYEELEGARYEVDNYYKSLIVIAFLEYRKRDYKVKLDLVKDRLVQCLTKYGIEITNFQKMTKAQKLPIQKKCFPELHRK